MGFRGYNAAGPVRPADGPELGEGGRPVDGRLIDAHFRAELVFFAIRGHVAQHLDGCVIARTGLVLAIPLNHVPLYQRIPSPAIEGEIGIAFALNGARVADVSA